MYFVYHFEPKKTELLWCSKKHDNYKYINQQTKGKVKIQIIQNKNHWLELIAGHNMNLCKVWHVEAVHTQILA